LNRTSEEGSVTLLLPIPRSLARGFLAFIEAGCLATYGFFFVCFREISYLPGPLAPRLDIALRAMLAALCGAPMRLCILSAATLDYLDLSRKSRGLFPALVLVD